MNESPDMSSRGVRPATASRPQAGGVEPAVVSAVQSIKHERVPLPQIPLYRFLAPRYWAVWVGLGVVRLVNLLPLRMQLALGRSLGRLAMRFDARDRRIAGINIGLCLRELDDAERARVLREHFESLGCSVFETGLVWWASDARLSRLVRTEGLEHLQAALQRGRGALMLSAHFTTLEMGARVLTMLGPTSFMYLTPNNPLVAELSRRGRSRHSIQAIASDQIRELLTNLKKNRCVWYAPDQRFNDKNSALVPFFGMPAGSNIATSRLAKISGAPVLPFLSARLPDNSGYLITIHPPLENFPSNDAIADTERYHGMIEAHARRYPSQYLWAYKRFKRPGYDPYSKSATR